MPWRSRFLGAALAALLASSPARRAFAQEARGPICVLGFVATPTEDEAARTMIAVLESSAARVGFTVAPGMPALEQALAMAGCEEAFMDDCMPQVVRSLGVSRVIYGRVSRTGATVAFELSMYDAGSRSLRRAARIDVARAMSVDSDTLRRVARRAIDQLVPPASPAPPDRASGAPAASVAPADAGRAGASASPTPGSGPSSRRP